MHSVGVDGRPYERGTQCSHSAAVWRRSLFSADDVTHQDHPACRRFSSLQQAADLDVLRQTAQPSARPRSTRVRSGKASIYFQSCSLCVCRWRGCRDYSSTLHPGNIRRARGTSHPFPLPFPPLPLPPSLSLAVGRLNTARECGERCKLPQRGPWQSPRQNQV